MYRPIFYCLVDICHKKYNFLFELSKYQNHTLFNFYSHILINFYDNFYYNDDYIKYIIISVLAPEKSYNI